VTQEHLNLSYVGVLQEPGGVGVAENMRGNAPAKDLETYPGNELLNAVNGHVSATARSRKEKCVVSEGRKGGVKGLHVIEEREGAALRDRHRPANHGFSSSSPDPDLNWIEFLKRDVAKGKLDQLTYPQAAIHEN
jgi:hypothetical protein